MKAISTFLSDVWRLARPYFRSEEKWSAWTLLIAIIALNLSMVGMNVVLNFWNRLFFNSLQTKNYQAFIDLLFTWRRTPGGWIMPGFCGVVAVYIVVSIYATYLNQWLQIRWRRWLTRRFLDEWLADRAYYRISLAGESGGIGTDNPDQRIAEDIRDFVATTLSLSVDFLSNIVSFVSFVGILWGLSGEITVFGVTVWGYMVWVALAYAMLGTWLTHLVGRPLIALRFSQQRVEADFRYALVRLRENVEGVALYGGEMEEKGNLQDRFRAVILNWWSIMTRIKRLNALVAGYSQIAIIFPFVVAAPRYFSGQIELGGLTQTAGAFGRVQESLSWFVNAYATLAQWRAVVERLAGFHRAVVVARAAGQGFSFATSPDRVFRFDDITLALPDGTPILDHASLRFRPGESVVITGRSGSGKSTLFRAVAGIWPFGQGRVERPAETCLFLPQRPYIPLGTLRHVVTYPAPPGSVPQLEIERALEDSGLPNLIPYLDEDANWAQRLSGGEQQRVALARALLARPDWLFLDEATASLDPEAETELYRVLKRRLPATTIVSIAHRPSVAEFHDRRLVLERPDGQRGDLVTREPAPAPAGGG
ncbi:MAG TPA: ABC transporter ATP-binding protein/permease [Acetobacteraceae bacterium]|jgi:putative ATP-binding cassette transporter|nr:ABC transporter ATP-binding protein/permease [Acetobacteraceae bacterium]